jgi:hypothetical protein
MTTRVGLRVSTEFLDNLLLFIGARSWFYETEEERVFLLVEMKHWGR